MASLRKWLRGMCGDWWVVLCFIVDVGDFFWFWIGFGLVFGLLIASELAVSVCCECSFRFSQASGNQRFPLDPSEGGEKSGSGKEVLRFFGRSSPFF